MGKKMGVVLLFISLFGRAQAKASLQCENLNRDLRAMQAAQSQLMSSFAQKNQTMALVLEQNADRLENKMTQIRSLKHSDLDALRVSAQAFRNYEEKEKALVERFEKASAELLSKVESCLERESKTYKKLGQR
jgi:hypothetical protein